MAIKFRCTHCQKLMSISSRKAGKKVTCPVCKEKTVVPLEGDKQENDKQESLSSETAEAADLTEKKEKQHAKPAAVTSKSEKSKSEKPAPATVQKKSAKYPQTTSSNRWDDENGEEEDFQIRKADTEFDDMDLTPMVDVTFLLLIFFMITASFSLQKTMQIPPPDPDKQGAAQSAEMLEELLDESIQVDINENNQIFIDDEPLADINELVSTLKDKMFDDGKSELIVKAHAISLHENVILVIDAAKEVGMQKIRLATSSVEDDE